MPRAATAADAKRLPWTHPALWSAIAGVALFLPSLPYGFVWDDHSLIESNALLRSISGLMRSLRSDFWLIGSNASGLWRPWITLSYWLDGSVSQWSPGWMRLMNVLAHGGASALVAALALGSGAPSRFALLAGLWFAAMPSHVESVAWIAGRTDVYCTAFFLLALWLDRRARRAGARWSGPGSLLALAISLLSKEVAVAYVPVLAVCEWVEGRGRRRTLADQARWIAPALAVTAAYLAIHSMLVHAPAPPAHFGAARARELAATWLMIPAYLAFLWPMLAHSPAVTLRLPAAAISPEVLIAAAFSIGCLAALGLAIARRSSLAVPLALLGIALLPTLAINLTHGYLIYGERYFYLASAGAAWALGPGLLAVAPRSRAARVAPWLAVALVAASAVQTSRLLPAWGNDDTLFESMTVLQPGNYAGRVQWARRLADRGRLGEAERQLAAAARLDPGRPEAFSVRAVIASRAGDWTSTIAYGDSAIAHGDTQLEPRLLRVTALLELRRFDEARRSLQRLRAARPPEPDLEAVWGQYLIASGQTIEAQAALERASRLFPRDPDLAYSLGLAEVSGRRAPEAIAAFRRAVALEPNHYDAWLQLAMASFLAGDVAASREALGRAAALPAAADGRARELGQLIERASPPSGGVIP